MVQAPYGRRADTGDLLSALSCHAHEGGEEAYPYGITDTTLDLRGQKQCRDRADHEYKAAHGKDPCEPYFRKTGCKAAQRSQNRSEKAAAHSG